MDEELVIEKTMEWLKQRCPGASVAREKAGYIDVSVVRGNTSPWTENTSLTFLAQVECKGNPTDQSATIQHVDSALGQSIRYLIENRIEGEMIPTYLAVPTDYFKLAQLSGIIKVLDTPLGLLVVSPAGEVTVEKESLVTPPTRPMKDFQR